MNPLEEEKLLFGDKLLMIKLINNLHKQSDPLDFKFMEMMFPFVILNGALFGWYFSRKMTNTALCTMYSALVMLTYGQVVEFRKALSYDTPQSLYARVVYNAQYPDTEYQRRNDEFIKKYL